MEVTGMIREVLQSQEGIGKNGNPWKVQGYVLETMDEYPKKIAFEVFGAERIENNKCEVNDLVTISFDIDSREYNGRWFTSVRAWKVEKQGHDILAAEPVEEEAVEAVEQVTDELPF